MLSAIQQHIHPTAKEWINTHLWSQRWPISHTGFLHLTLLQHNVHISPLVMSWLCLNKIYMYINFSFQNLIQITGLKWALGHGVRVKDGFLFTSLHRVTFTLGCCPILSPGVARRQEHPHCKCILGNDGTNKIILQICNLLCAFSIVITWVSETAACYENVLF